MTTATRERRLILRDWEVRAILLGRKTRTTRLVKLSKFQPDDTPGYDWIFRDRHQRWNSYREKDLIAKRCPYGQPGDRLWCAEGWRVRGRHTDACSVEEISANRSHFSIWRQADVTFNDDFLGKVRSPATMPRWASRLTLEITGVRVQRVQEITEEEAIAEGFESTAILTEDGGDYTGLYAHEHFQTQWALDYGMDAVEENQFVWVIEHWRIDA